MGYNETTILREFFHIKMLVKPKNKKVPKEFMQLGKILLGLGYTPDSIMREIMQPCNEMVKQCFIRYKKTSCEELFFVSRAAEGYCCSFNSILAKYNFPYYLC